MNILLCMLFAACIAMGCAACFACGMKYATDHAPTAGSFEINSTDPTKDLCRLILDKDLDYIEEQKRIVLNVIIEDGGCR